MILPNIKKAWKIYLFAVAGALVMSYLNELLMYLMFRGEVSFQAGAFTLRGLGEIFGMTILGVLASVEMLGEELGWLGWLFPKLEKMHGTKAAMLLLALIRTMWHLGIIFFLPHPLIGLCDLFLSNLLSQGFLVYLTKKSASLFPAAVVHAVTNLLPALVAYSDSFYQAHIVPMNGAGLVSAAVVGGISYLLMRKEKMFVQGAGNEKRAKGTVHKLWNR
jgi:membrane protease YdiL (CAAX protease family)